MQSLPCARSQEDPTPSGAKKSGWGDAPVVDDEGGSAAAAPVPGRRRRAAADDDDDDDGANSKKHDSMTSSNKHDIAEINDDDNDTIANLIPDLEDEQEDMARQVAEAPQLTKSRVQSIKELDEQIDMALPSASEIGIDLSVLQSYLMPQEQVGAQIDAPPRTPTAAVLAAPARTRARSTRLPALLDARESECGAPPVPSRLVASLRSRP